MTARIRRSVTKLEYGAPPRAMLTALFLAIAASMLAAAPTIAQENQQAGQNGRLAVFLDCEGGSCNDLRTFFRTEITWVDWVRDRADSDVHVIVTSQRTGSGGNEYRLDFIGREELVDNDDQLFFRSLGTDVEQEEYDGVTTTLAIGLARYATLAGLRGFATIDPATGGRLDASARVVGAQEVDDPWRLWVFDIGASGTLDGTDVQDTERLSGDFSATRTTPTWKLGFGLSGNRNVIKTQLSDSSTFTSTLVDWRADAHLVYAVARHWSVGIISAMAKDPRNNQYFRLEVTPALEFSFFPYEEATRKMLAARYAIGPTYRDYEEATIFGETVETRYEESLRFRYAQRQPWGDGSVTVTMSHLLDDFDKHNVSLRGDLSFRVVRGLSVNAGANASWVTDQIYLSASGETDEEILLNLRTRASDFNYGFNVGFSYRFGSIFNNVVNNRFVTFPGGG